MPEAKIIVGVDIGSAKIVTLIAKISEEQSVNVLGVSDVKSAGIKKGQIVAIEEAVGAVNASLEAAERMAGYSATKVIVSIGGSHIESQNSRGVVAVAQPEGEITQTDVDRVIDAAKAVSFPTSREIIHILPRSYIVDGQEGIKAPVGMTGVRLEVETHLITAGTTSLKNLEKALSEVGVDVAGMVFNGYASSLAVLSDTEKELGVVLVDIGAGTTDISIYVDGAVAHSSVLPIGARHITNDLAIGLRISLESAEKLKLFLSDPHRKGQDEANRFSDELDLASLKLPEELKKVSYKTLVEGIMRPRLNEIFTMVGLELKKSGWGGQTPAGIVVTGGGAKTVGIVEAAKRSLAMPVRIGIPSGLRGIIDEVQDPSFATAVGLILYGATESLGSSSQFKFSVSSFKGLPMGKFGKKIIDLLKSFIP